MPPEVGTPQRGGCLGVGGAYSIPLFLSKKTAVYYLGKCRIYPAMFSPPLEFDGIGGRAF
jgi:hypothetical protein